MSAKSKSYLTFASDKENIEVEEIWLGDIKDPAMAFKLGIKSITPYLLFLTFVTTLGPLQFGYHLVGFCCTPGLATSSNTITG
jgi:hypothetical protein